MIADRYLIKLLAIGPILVIPAMVALIAVLVIHSEEAAFQKTSERLETKYLESKQASIRAKVDSIAELTAYRKSIVKKELHERIQQRVEDAYKVANAIYTQYSQKLSENEVKKMIISALRPLTWNDGESYIWIVDYKGISQLSPDYLRHLEGTSIIKVKDADGHYVIRQEIAIARAKGEGFLWDSFTKPDLSPDKKFEQLAFVKAFGHYNWYLGSAEFLDTARARNDKELLETISKVDKDDSTGYVFIIGRGGRIFLNSSRPDLEGKQMLGSGDPNIQDIAEKIQKALDAKSTDFIRYQWVNPVTHKLDLKHTYVTNVPNSEWVIGSGYYDRDIQSELDSVKKTLNIEYKYRLENIKKISLLSFVVAVLVSLYLSLTVKRLLRRYQGEVASKNKQLVELNASLEARVAKRTKELQKANRKLELLAMTDNLTGIMNRYAFMNLLEDEAKRSDRYQSHFSLIMFDIDFFKNVNDEYGHDVGDNVLVSLANLVHSCLRDVDKFCRLGGEEFLVMLPSTKVQDAAQIAERVRKAVEDHPFKTVEHLTISLGVVEHRQHERPSATLKRVDVALYQSKEEGRNRVTVIEE